MIYYRVAFCGGSTSSVNQTAVWKWRSTILTSPHALSALLRAYNYIPKEQIRVFFASSEEYMDAMLARQNQGQISTSVTAEQILSSKSITAPDVKRLEYELSLTEASDVPYIFTAPTGVRELSAWTQLARKVRGGELEL